MNKKKKKLLSESRSHSPSRVERRAPSFIIILLFSSSPPCTTIYDYYCHYNIIIYHPSIPRVHKFIPTTRTRMLRVCACTTRVSRNNIFSISLVQDPYRIRTPIMCIKNSSFFFVNILSHILLYPLACRRDT